MPSQSRIGLGATGRTASSNRRNSLSSAHSFERNTNRWTGGSSEGPEGMEHGPGDGEGQGEGLSELGEMDAETRTENSRDGLLSAEPASLVAEPASLVDEPASVVAEPGPISNQAGLRPAMTATSATKRFQSSVRRAILIRRNGQYDEKAEERGSRSREPGIDPRKVELPGLQSKVVIQTVDYSREKAEFQVLTNDTFGAYLAKPRTLPIRWIHVNGLDWEVLKMLALEYDLHPLSLEDVLHHGTSAARSKVDYYAQHLFASIVVHTTPPLDDSDSSTSKAPPSKFRQQPISRADSESNIESTGARPKRSERLDRLGYPAFEQALEDAFKDQEVLVDGKENRTLRSNTLHTGEHFSTRSQNRRSRQRDTLTAQPQVPVLVEKLSIFLLSPHSPSTSTASTTSQPRPATPEPPKSRTQTIISISQHSTPHPKLSGVFGRIDRADSVVRTREDASLVLHGLLDVVGDEALAIVERFRSTLEDLEGKVLASANMKTVRHLHSLSAQLLLLKSTVSPLHALIQSIRYSDSMKTLAVTRAAEGISAAATNEMGKVAGGKKTQQGFVSSETKVYLGDVLDHVEGVLSSLDLFSGIAENLIAYTFNDLSYSSNTFIKGLSILSVIFLPLTFLSGYFGMNFGSFDHVLDGDVSYFWSIAIPVTATTLSLFAWEYFVAVYQLARRTLADMYYHLMDDRRND